MDVVSIIPAFLLILLAELGDKTQLAVITLSCRYSAVPVFAGAMLGFLLVDGLSIVLGASLLGFLPMQWVAAGSGVIFILFGIIGFFSRDKEDIKIRKASKLPILTSFSLITLNELGDKTQIAAIALAAETSAMPVLLGVMLAFTILTATAVTIGGRLLSRAPLKWLRTAMTVLFVTLGIISILSTFIDLHVF